MLDSSREFRRCHSRRTVNKFFPALLQLHATSKSMSAPIQRPQSRCHAGGGINFQPRISRMDTNDSEMKSHRSKGFRFSKIRFIRGQKISSEHPTNGLALCRNQHWATDRSLISPCPDHQWKASTAHDPNCSNGEKELLERSGKSLLLPKDTSLSTRMQTA